MVATETIPNSMRLAQTRRRVEQWRETRPHRHAPMPAALWAAAVAAARQHGLSRTARTLRVDYGALKKHLEASADTADALASPTFVEFASVMPASLGACVIEREGPGGTLRLRLPGLALPDLVALSRALFGGEA